MPQKTMTFRVLVASPSDCFEERKIIPEVIAAWNNVHSVDAAAVIQPVMWETHTWPALGDRPQSIINQQLIEHCDFLVGTFWTRFGSPTGVADSGTAEEIEQFRSAGKPVLLYFSSTPLPPENVDPQQYQALLAYRSRLASDGLYFQYKSPAEFREHFQHHLAKTMLDLLRKNNHISGSIGSPIPDAQETTIQPPFNIEQRVTIDGSGAEDKEEAPQTTVVECYRKYPRDQMVHCLSVARREIWILQTWFSNWSNVCDAFRIAVHRARKHKSDHQNFRIRLILTHPDSKFLELRGVHSGRDSAESTKQAKVTLKELIRLKQLEKFDDQVLEIRLSGEYPTFAVFASDDSVFFNPYLRKHITYESPCLRFGDHNIAFVSKLREHFESLWDALGPQSIESLEAATKDKPKKKW
jgi:hypothetical protein